MLDILKALICFSPDEGGGGGEPAPDASPAPAAEPVTTSQDAPGGAKPAEVAPKAPEIAIPDKSKRETARLHKVIQNLQAENARYKETIQSREGLPKFDKTKLEFTGSGEDADGVDATPVAETISKMNQTIEALQARIDGFENAGQTAKLEAAQTELYTKIESTVVESVTKALADAPERIQRFGVRAVDAMLEQALKDGESLFDDNGNLNTELLVQVATEAAKEARETWAEAGESYIRANQKAKDDLGAVPGDGSPGEAEVDESKLSRSDLLKLREQRSRAAERLDR